MAVKDLLWLVYLYPLRFLTKRLPLRVVYGLARLADPVFQLVTRRQRLKAQARMARTLKATDEESARLARRFVRNAVWRSVDDLVIGRLIAGGEIHANIEGLEHLKSALARGRGVLLMGAHCYGYRLAKRYLSEMGYSMLGVRNALPPDEMMGRVGARFLKKRYVDFLHEVLQDEVMLQDPEMALKMFKRLRSGGLVYVHLDAVFSNAWMELPFLGNPKKKIATGVWEIVRLSGCAVLPLFCGGDHRALAIRIGEALDLKPAASRDEFAAANLPGILATVESYILQHPDQWDSWVRLG